MSSRENHDDGHSAHAPPPGSGETAQTRPMKRLNAEIPADLHSRFKAKAAREDRKMSDVLRDLIDGYLSR